MFRRLFEDTDTMVMAEMIVGLDVSIIALRDTCRTHSDEATLRFLLSCYGRFMNVWRRSHSDEPVVFLERHGRGRHRFLSYLVHLFVVRSSDVYTGITIDAAKVSQLRKEDVVRVSSILDEASERALARVS